MELERLKVLLHKQQCEFHFVCNALISEERFRKIVARHSDEEMF